MAHVTAIVSATQVEYRIVEGHGCGDPGIELDDTQSEYRVAGMGGVQMWVGEGLADAGLTAGRVWAEHAAGVESRDAAAARALMAGVHPGTGETLVAPVLRLPEEAKLPAVALVDAVIARGREGQATQSARGAGDWTRLVEGVRRLGDGYTADVRVLARVASRAGVDLDSVYGGERVAQAQDVAARERVDVRTKGYDLTLTLPKSFSVAWALAPAGERQAIADAYTQAALDVVAAADGWHARATRGHHGGGQSAEIVQTSGLIGWLSVDPVNRNGDTHWHAHVTLAAMGKADDGGWSALASAGTDSLFGSVGALGGLMEARARAITAERFGWEFRESSVTDRLEVAHVPDAAIRATSTRRADVVQAMIDAGLDPAAVTREEDEAAGQAARKSKVSGLEHARNVVERTRAQVTAEGVQLVGGPADGRLPRPAGPLPVEVLRPAEAAARTGDGRVVGSWDAAVADSRALLLDPEAGPTAHAQTFTWRQALGLVAASVHGGADQAQYELLLAAALDTPEVVRLPDRPGRSPQFTTRAVLDAEQTVMHAAKTARGGGAPTVAREHLEHAVETFTARAGYAPSAEQLSAVKRICLGGDRLDVLTGLPGTGKTTVMRIVGDAFAAAGHRVRGVSTAALAAENLAVEAGFGARTIAYELHMGTVTQGLAVLVVDEAGMVDTRDMAALLEMAAATGTKVVAIGDDRQLGAVGIGGWFAPAREATDGGLLVDVRRQREEHELAALRAFRAGAEHAALAGYAAGGQIVVTDTRDQAMAAAAAVWHGHAQHIENPLQRATEVALISGRREETQVLNALARARAREAGHLTGQDVTYRLMGGGELRLAEGDVVVLRRNDKDGKRNGRRAVVEGIDRERQVTVAWLDAEGKRRRVLLTPGDVVAGQVATSYLEADHVQGAAAGTVHVTQGRTVEHTVAVIDPTAHASTYVALSRDRASTTLVLSVEAVTDTPEEQARITGLPIDEREAAVIALYAGRLHEAGVFEAEGRQLLEQRWPELAVTGRTTGSPPAPVPVETAADPGRGPTAGQVDVLEPLPAQGPLERLLEQAQDRQRTASKGVAGASGEPTVADSKRPWAEVLAEIKAHAAETPAKDTSARVAAAAAAAAQEEAARAAERRAAERQRGPRPSQ